jgi:hypothetical protein
MKYLAIMVMMFTIMGLYLSRPTPEDIQICVDETNWTPERCYVELTR